MAGLSKNAGRVNARGYLSIIGRHPHAHDEIINKLATMVLFTAGKAVVVNVPGRNFLGEDCEIVIIIIFRDDQRKKFHFIFILVTGGDNNCAWF